jgi:uncharacterized protein (DUF362 family)
LGFSRSPSGLNFVFSKTKTANFQLCGAFYLEVSIHKILFGGNQKTRASMKYMKKNGDHVFPKERGITRRDLLKAGIGITLGTAAASIMPQSISWGEAKPLVPQLFDGSIKPVVSVVQIKNDQIAYSVEEAIDLLGGLETVAKGKEKIMLKPNLVIPDPRYTTNLEVMKTLAQLMKKSGKQVLIGEGSAAAPEFNVKGTEVYRTKNRKILDAMQKLVFEKLGYTDLAKALDVPLINLHSGDMVDVPVPNGYAFDKITLHRSLTDIDLLCSVPMMKTHSLATVTLGMKNLIGVYPGTVYYSVRSWLHDRAHDKGSPGIAYEIIDAVKANKLGLTVVDAHWAIEGQGPTIQGKRLKMDLIVAGTNPLATDMVAAKIMGFEMPEVPTFTFAHKAGMKPTNIDEIEVRGAKMSDVKKDFLKPKINPWRNINKVWGAKVV